MKTPQILSTAILSASLLALPCAAHAGLVHRYSFSGDATSTVATDSVGTANGTLEGGATLTGSGAVTLDGVSGFVNLPNGIISSLTDITIVTWVNWNGGANWQRLFDFGTSDAGEDMQGTGQAFFFLTPQSGAAGTPMLLGKTGEPDLTAAALPTGQQVQVAVVYSPSANYSALFVNGQLLASGTAGSPLSAVNDVNNWLGRSQYAADAYFSGSITEFRIYDSALSRLEVALSAQAGPDQLGGSDPGAVQSVAVNVQPTMYVGNSQQASATATFENLTNFDLTGDPEAVYSSGNTNLLQVSSNGLVQADAKGSAEVIVTYRSVQGTNSVTVLAPPSIAPVIKHRYSFSEAAGAMTAADSVGTADGTLEGGSYFDGFGNLYLDGVDSYVDLPNGIVSSNSAVTVEAWVFWSGGATWQRLFDFGTSDAGEGQQGTNGLNFIFFTPAGGPDPGTARLGVAGQADTVGSVAITAGTPTAVAVVYNPIHNVSSIYLNGTLVGSGTATVPLSSIDDVNDWIGRSQFSADAYFSGSLTEFRIYEGVLSPESVAFDSAAGPDVLVTDPGNLQSINLQVPSQYPTLGDAPMNATVHATYDNIADVDVTSFNGITFESSDTNVVTVTQAGEIDAAGEGTATVTARFQGLESSLDITVFLPPGYTPPQLIHRYSFDEAPGSMTVKDSVGNADGTLRISGTFSGTGTLTLNGTGGFVDLPNGLVSGLQDVTIEAWVNWTSQRYWERIFDFGTSDNGQGQSGTGQAFMFLAPRGGASPGGLFFGLAGNADVIAPSLLPDNRLVQVVVSYDATTSCTRLYVDGQRVAVGPASAPLSGIQDVNVWLGRSQFSADPYFTGSFDEFRIYDGALLDAAVAASFAAGPEMGAVKNPVLSFSVSGKDLTLSWPTNGTSGFSLRSSGELGAGQNWTNVGTMINTSGPSYQVTVPALHGQQYFRLEQ